MALLGDGRGETESENRGREDSATLSTDGHETVVENSCDSVRR